jgi:hypothetical protein
MAPTSLTAVGTAPLATAPSLTTISDWIPDARGVLVENLDGVDVAENFFENTYGATGDFAIELIASTNSTLNGNRGNNTIDGAISLDGTSDNNIAIGNNFQGATYSNLGAANDLAHNK